MGAFEGEARAAEADLFLVHGKKIKRRLITANESASRLVAHLRRRQFRPQGADHQIAGDAVYGLIAMKGMSVITVPATGHGAGRGKAGKVAETLFQIGDVVTTLIHQPDALGQQAAPDGRLDLAKAVIEAHHVDQIGLALAGDHRLGVVADQAYAVGQPRIVGGANPAFAGVDVFVVIETEYPDMTD